MNNDRIKQLEKFLADDPHDPFTKYALAIEHLKIDKAKSRKLFEDLLENHPDYIGTYYHAAALYTELNERDLAEKVYKKGIEKATELHQAHALRELQSAYLNFQFDE